MTLNVNTEVTFQMDTGTMVKAQKAATRNGLCLEDYIRHTVKLLATTEDDTRSV